VRGITPAHREHLEAEYPGRFTFEAETDTWDYLYLAEKLATYAGKALHGKKNHCNRFEAENDWEFKPLTYELIPGCLDMLVVWNEENAARLDPSVVYEHDAVVRAFAAYERLGLEGGALRVGGKIVGFTIGEMCSSDTFDVLVEMPEDLFGDTVAAISRREKQIVSSLKSMLGIVAKVRLVEPKSIERSEGKAVRVIDKRKLY